MWFSEMYINFKFLDLGALYLGSGALILYLRFEMC